MSSEVLSKVSVQDNRVVLGEGNPGFVNQPVAAAERSSHENCAKIKDIAYSCWRLFLCAVLVPRKWTRMMDVNRVLKLVQGLLFT